MGNFNKNSESKPDREVLLAWIRRMLSTATAEQLSFLAHLIRGYLPKE